jgi:hypothetical protein
MAELLNPMSRLALTNCSLFATVPDALDTLELPGTAKVRTRLPDSRHPRPVAAPPLLRRTAAH